jgi:hypothetical protein
MARSKDELEALVDALYLTIRAYKMTRSPETLQQIAVLASQIRLLGYIPSYVKQSDVLIAARHVPSTEKLAATSVEIERLYE